MKLESFISTKRFILKNLSTKHVTQEYLSWFQDKTIMEEITASYSPQDIEKLKKYVFEKTNKEDCLFLGIFDKESNLHLGNIKYEPIDLVRSECVMGILIGENNFRGKGLAGEVMSASEAYLKKYLGINKILLGVNATNLNAIKAYEKHGFKKLEPLPYPHNKDSFTMQKMI